MGCSAGIQTSFKDQLLQIRNKRNIEYKKQTFTKEEMLEIIEGISENNVLEKLVLFDIKISSGKLLTYNIQ